MSRSDLARRAGVSHQYVSRIEREDAQGKASLNALQKLAASMDCDVQIVLTPRRPLADQVSEQARRRATEQVERLRTTMALENESLDDDTLDAMIENLVRKWVDRRDLWRDDASAA